MFLWFYRICYFKSNSICLALHEFAIKSFNITTKETQKAAVLLVFWYFRYAVRRVKLRSYSNINRNSAVCKNGGGSMLNKYCLVIRTLYVLHFDRTKIIHLQVTTRVTIGPGRSHFREDEISIQHFGRFGRLLSSTNCWIKRQKS